MGLLDSIKGMFSKAPANNGVAPTSTADTAPAAPVAPASSSMPSESVGMPTVPPATDVPTIPATPPAPATDVPTIPATPPAPAPGPGEPTPLV